MTRAPLAMLAAGIAAVLVGCGALVYTAYDYLAHPLAIDSNAGRRVFASADGGFVSYDPFQPGIGPNLITVGVVLVFAALFLLAVLWPGKRAHSAASRRATAGSNAAAQTRYPRSLG